MRIVGASIPVTANVRENVRWIYRAAVRAASLSADLLLTPECSVSGYESIWDADLVTAGLDRVATMSVETGVTIGVGAFVPAGDGRSANEVRLYTGGRIASSYRKRVLVGSGASEIAEPDERSLLAPGDVDMDLLTGGVRFSALICNDLWANPLYSPAHVDDLVARAAGRGIDCLLHAVNTGIEAQDDKPEDDWVEVHRWYHESNLRLRSRAQTLPIVTVDVADGDGGVMSSSPSGFIGADGRWAGRIDRPGPHIIVGDLDQHGYHREVKVEALS